MDFRSNIDMKRVLFYFNSMTPAGGIERVISTLANKFKDEYEITILVKDRAYSHYKLDSSIRLLSLDLPLSLNMDSKIKRFFSVFRSLVSTNRKLKKFLNSEHYDYYYLPHPLNVLEFHLAKGIDHSVVITEHGGVDAYNFVYKSIKKWLYSKAKVYVIPTKTDSAFYSTLGFDTKYIPHFKSDLAYCKGTLANNIALNIGRVTEAKRQYILIDLWYNIVYRHNINNWLLYIVGEGNLKDLYLKKIEHLGLTNYVKILPPKKDVEDYYKQSALFLLTSESEGFGMVLLEAMSFGIPCISYDCPAGPRDMITDGINGYLVENNNFKNLELRVLDLLNNRDRLLSMGEEGYQLSNLWNDNNIMKLWREVLQ